jgi:hypothetical protein
MPGDGVAWSRPIYKKRVSWFGSAEGKKNLQAGDGTVKLVGVFKLKHSQ